MRVDRKARGPDTGLRTVGSHYVRQTRWGDIVQKWPRKRPVDITPGAYYQQMEWAYACSWASRPEPMSYATAVHLSEGTELLPRDILVMAMYGTLYEFHMPDGSVIARARDMSPNAQFVLDMIGTLNGSMLYRSPAGWVIVPPGSSGQVMTIAEEVPYWADYPALVFSELTVLMKDAHAGLDAARLVKDSTSIAIDWAVAGEVKYKRAALIGDVSAAADSNTLTIGARKVTVGMMPAVSAQNRVLARISSGAGDIQEATISQVLEMLGTSARGDVVVRDATGWTRLAAGTSGQFLQTRGTANDAQWATPSGSGGVSTIDIQAFTTPGSFSGASGWQKPTGGKLTRVVVVGAGGPGGAGRRGPTTENSAGGGGGGPGGLTWTEFLTSSLPSSVDLVVGAKGASVAGQTVNATNGSTGAPGGDSYFGTLAASAYFVFAQGGRAGNGGTTSAVLGGAAGAGRKQGTTGGTGNNASNGAAPAAPTELTPTGGGGGGGLVATTRLTRNGGDGGGYSTTAGFSASGHTNTIAAGGVGSTKTAAQPGTATGYEIACGQGGGGGWCNVDGTAGNGADGAQPGGGGGGGGASNNGTVSGASGNGGDGAVYVITYF